MNPISGSRLPLYFKCVGAAVIPSSPRANPTREKAAERGTALHLFLQRCSEIGRTNALLEMEGSPWLSDAMRLRIEGTPAAMPGSFTPELSVAWSPSTGRARLGEPEGDEIGGTLDALGVSEGAVHVADYKTGSTWFDSPVSNPQLRFYEMCAAKIFDRERGELSIIKFDEAGFPVFVSATIEQEERVAFEAELRAFLAVVREVEPLPLERLPLTQGEHCTNCDSFARCPAKAVLLALAPSEVTPREIRAESFPAALEKIAALRAACDEAERAMREALRALGPVQRPDGKWLAVVPVDKARVLDLEKAKQAIAAEYGEGGLASVLEVTESISVGDIDKLVAQRHRAAHGRGGVTAAKKAARERLRDLGALGFDREYHLKALRKAPELEAGQSESDDP